jgi:hypothetical protein
VGKNPIQNVYLLFFLYHIKFLAFLTSKKKKFIKRKLNHRSYSIFKRNSKNLPHSSKFIKSFLHVLILFLSIIQDNSKENINSTKINYLNNGNKKKVPDYNSELNYNCPDNFNNICRSNFISNSLKINNADNKLSLPNSHSYSIHQNPQISSASSFSSSPSSPLSLSSFTPFKSISNLSPISKLELMGRL